MPNDPKPEPRPSDPHAGPIRSAFADDADMREIVQMFVDEMPTRVVDLTRSWQLGQVEQLKRLSHQLKGASGGYGFPDVGHAAGRLEASLLDLGDAERLELLRTQFDELVDLCRRVAA